MFKKKNIIKLKIEFDKDSKEMELKVKPKDTRPTEIIQMLIFAVNILNQALSPELKEMNKESKKEKLDYVG